MLLFSSTDSTLLRSDRLSWLLAGLIVFVVTHVLIYSSRYLAGDRNFRCHRRYVLLLGASVLTIVFADHLLLLLIGWGFSNLLMVRLMIHKPEWRAARNGGYLALRTFIIGFILLTGGFLLLAEGSGTPVIHEIVAIRETSPPTFIGLILVAVAALTQSAAWPFHHWLISSLNSPTPLSALMHAGVVNGGGFLLARFAPIYVTQPIVLHGLFTFGLITALVGTFWKFLQPDVKRMLACSTMGQMGFMLMQCGMGLFASAISHLCWHGLFKAYLFLNTGSVIRQEPLRLTKMPLTPIRLLLTLLIGALGAFTFSMVSGIQLSFMDTECIMIVLAFLAAAQLAAGLLEQRLIPFNIIATALIGIGSGALYGLSVTFVETILASLPRNAPQPLDLMYISAVVVFLLVWIAMNLPFYAQLNSLTVWKRLYVMALNSSQPHPETVTATRTSYQF